MTRLPQVTQTRGLTTWRRTAPLLSSVLLVLAMIAAMARSPLADEGQEAADFVRGFSNQALTMLSDETLDSEARTREFRRLLTAGFHLEVIGRFVLGRHWRRASESERAEFGQLFEDYIVASYSRQLSEYGGEQLVVEGGRPKGKSGAIVSSRIIRRQGEPFRVEWRLRRGGEGWRIIDVVIEGVSMVVTHRSEFSSVIASRGGTVGGLLEVLRSKTAQPEVHAAAGSDEAS
jgi:phospholipid transport system substrate-binding protein